MNQKDIDEFNELILSHCKEKGFEMRHVLAYLTALFVSAMENGGFTRQEVDMLLQIVKKKFKSH